MGTSSIKKLNLLIEDLREELDILHNRDLLLLLMYVDKKSRTISEIQQALKNEIDSTHLDSYLKDLSMKGFIKQENNHFMTTGTSKELLRPIYFSQYDVSSIPHDIIPEYKILNVLGTGSTSVTFKAEKPNYSGYYYAIKVIKPGVYEKVDIAKCMNEISILRSYKDYLVIPLEWGKFNYRGIDMYYFVMEYVEGIPLKTFFDKSRVSNIRRFISNYIEQVGTVLQEMEKVGKFHSDLHPGNILVVEDVINREHHFKVIDYIGLVSKESFRKYEYLDFDYFVLNLKQIITNVALTPKGESDKDILGGKLFSVYNNVLNGKYKSINDFFADYRNVFIPTGIEKEIYRHPFRIFIFEDYNINEPEWLEIFEPSPNYYGSIKEFGNVILSGPRGCGKTIYLKSLSFVPKLIRKIENNPELASLKNKLPDYRQIFGVFFPCRQGEFKTFSTKFIEFTPQTILLIKHIFALKIVRKTISLISEGFEENIFMGNPNPEGVKAIFDFLENHLQQKIILMKTENIFSDLYGILKDIEIKTINKLGENSNKCIAIGALLNENVLIEFFDLVKQSVPELCNTRFYIIFDDVSDPNLSFDGQEILNHIVRANNSKYCIKLSTEKYAYNFTDSEGKKLESPHDYKYIDLGNWSAIDKYDSDLKKYFQDVVNRQLKTARYNVDITELLAELPYSHVNLITFLSERSKKERQGIDKLIVSRNNEEFELIDNKILYGGWDIVCQLSSFSVRVLLQICEAILNELPKERLEAIKSKPSGKQIDIQTQHKAIMKYSREEYSNLINISDLGKTFFDIVRNFGEISRDYLRRDINKKEGRKYELITIERSDNNKLDKDAERILQGLLRHSVFIDRGLTFAKSEIGLIKKITLHKKFCPGLKITFREREHLRLSSTNLEQFLLQPDKFTKSFIKKSEKQLELFDN